MKRASLLLAPLLLLAGCATTGQGGAPLALNNPDIASKTMDNGDKIDEYRVGGQLRMVKITPVRGAPYYLYDKNGDGHLDGDPKGVSPVYWKLYSW
jgi:hypothetical protein